jgi:ubiquinone/menaquinone biosynthesis C-methylase UbiE
LANVTVARGALLSLTPASVPAGAGPPLSSADDFEARAPMNALVERYHQGARDYERYWAPVLEASAANLVEYVEWYASGPPIEPITVLDVGTGTGSLAAAALARWPDAKLIASDAAAGMLEVARERLAGHGARVQAVVGPADRLPLADGVADLVVSSFVFQLVPDRRAALREAHRLLRPGGLLAYVTWLDRDTREPFLPLEEFDEAVLDLAIEEPEWPPEQCAGDVPSATAAAAQLRRAGFRDVVAREDRLEYDWTLETYLEYKLAYDERTLMAALDAGQRERLERSARERLVRLASDAFRWRPPIVFAAARRP